MRPDLRKLKVLMDLPPFKSKKEFKAFLGIMIYFSKCLLATAEVCKVL